jgi:hypothetical protein
VVAKSTKCGDLLDDLK